MSPEEQALNAANEALQAKGREIELNRRVAELESIAKGLRGGEGVKVVGGLISAEEQQPATEAKAADNVGFLDLWVPINGGAAQVRFQATIL